MIRTVLTGTTGTSLPALDSGVWPSMPAVPPSLLQLQVAIRCIHRELRPAFAFLSSHFRVQRHFTGSDSECAHKFQSLRSSLPDTQAARGSDSEPAWHGSRLAFAMFYLLPLTRF